MFINLWRPAWLVLPKKDGWYVCTTQDYWVRYLYFNTQTKRWVNVSRQTIFDGYKVYKPCRAPVEENRVYTDSDCEYDILAWKKVPLGYKWWKKEEKSDE